VEGIPNGRIVVGGGNNLSKVVFHLTDFHDYIGSGVRDEEGCRCWSGRLNLTGGNWSITIDAVPEGDERRKIAKRCGGTPVTHVGKLTRADGTTFTSPACDDVLESLQFFLSFVRGQWVAPIIAVGFDEDGNRVWQDWTLRRIGKAPAFDSWCPVHNVSFVEAVFPRFFERWMDPTWRGLLRPAIGTYLHGNRQGLLDGTIIFAQIVLEMIADFVLAEQTGQGSAAASEAGAEERIGLLFQRIPIPADIPEPLGDLREFVDAVHLPSGLATVTQIRNACVHHNAEGRRFLARLNSTKYAFFDATRLALWYTDLCLLWLLGYEGRYQSRVHAKWVGETEAVPWNKPLEYSLAPQLGEEGFAGIADDGKGN